MAIYWVLLSRILSRFVLGDVALANAVAMPVATLIDSGFSQYLIREYQPVVPAGLPPDLRRAVRRRYLLIFASVGTSTVVVSLLGDTLGRFWIGLCIAASYGLDAAGLVWLTRPRAALDARGYFAVRVTQSAGVCLVTFVAWQMGDTGGPTVAAIYSAVYVIAALIALCFWLKGPRWRAVGTATQRGLASRGRRRDFAIFAVLTTVYSRMDAIVVQIVLGSAVLSTYVLAFKLVEAARVIPGAVARVVLAASTRHAGRRERVLPAALGRSLGLCTGVGVSLLIAGPLLTRIMFGSGYADQSVTTIRLLACTVPGIGLTAPVSSLLLAWNHERAAAINSAATLAVTAAAVVGLVFPFGINGVAAGVLLGELVSVGQYLVELRRLSGARPGRTWSTANRHCAGVVVAFAVGAIAWLTVPAFSVVNLPLAAGVCVAWCAGPVFGFYHVGDWFHAKATVPQK